MNPPSPHLFCMETKFSLPIQSFLPLLLLFSIRPSLRGVLSPLLYTFQFPSFKVRVAIKLALNLPSSPLFPPTQLILFGFPHTHGNFFLGFCSILKLPRRRTCWSRYSRECPSLPSAVHFCNFVPTRASGFSMVFQETFFFHHFSLSAIFLCTN